MLFPPARTSGLRRACGVCALLSCAGLSFAASTLSLGLDPDLVAERKWGEGVIRYRDELLGMVKAETAPDAHSLARAYYRYELCHLFAEADGLSEKPRVPEGDVVTWLLANPAIARNLALAVEPEDDPTGVIAALAAILAAGDETAARYADLTVAFAVVWDKEMTRQRVRRGEYVPGGQPVPRQSKLNMRIPLHDPRPPEERIRALFSHFTSRTRRMHLDLTRVPWEFARFLACFYVTDAEREWAFRRYARRSDYSRIYGMVPYDAEYTMWEPGSHYTLENVRRWGGQCNDQAHFTASVARACGRPSIFIHGNDPTGIGHCWAMVLEKRGYRNYSWGVHGGTVDTLAFYEEPQTDKRYTMRQAKLLAEAVSQPASDRALAATHYETAALLRKDAPVQRVLYLVARSARTNPYDERPWRLIADMVGSGEATEYADAAALYTHVVSKFADFPEFTRDVLQSLIPLMSTSTTTGLDRVCVATHETFRDKPDIAAGLLTSLADYLGDHGKESAALATYRHTIRYYQDKAHLIVRALEAAEVIYRKREDVRQVVSMYERLFPIYARVKGIAVKPVRRTFYYRFAKKLGELYRETGDARKAAAMERRVAIVEAAIEKQEERQRQRGQR